MELYVLGIETESGQMALGKPHFNFLTFLSHFLKFETHIHELRLFLKIWLHYFIKVSYNLITYINSDDSCTVILCSPQHSLGWQAPLIAPTSTPGIYLDRFQSRKSYFFQSTQYVRTVQQCLQLLKSLPPTPKQASHSMSSSAGFQALPSPGN